jgi:hypothetical protein
MQGRWRCVDAVGRPCAGLRRGAAAQLAAWVRAVIDIMRARAYVAVSRVLCIAPWCPAFFVWAGRRSHACLYSPFKAVAVP